MKYIETPKAVKPLGPYSQGIVANGMVFVSGTVAVNPVSNAMVPGAIKEQTAQVLENIKAILEAGGSGLDKVVKATVFLKDGADFSQMNEVYASYFGANRPTRTTVVAGFVKEGILVEIDCIATL
jgi:2-iminobutanoate/2-iminopropanoate deaminase